MKLVGYVRVSTEGQADNFSLDAQKEKIESYCKCFGHELVEIFAEVGSGKKSETRPKFNQALDTVKNKAEGLIVAKLDRLARNTRDVLTVVEDVLAPDNKHLIILDLNVDTSTPTGKMILTVMASVATLELETIKERCATGKKAKKELGGYVGGRVPYGFDSINGELVENQAEQSNIELMRKHRRSGKSYCQIAKYLNDKQIPTKAGKQWQAKQIISILERI